MVSLDCERLRNDAEFHRAYPEASLYISMLDRNLSLGGVARELLSAFEFESVDDWLVGLHQNNFKAIELYTAFGIPFA